jgi:hypothetical protein
MRGLKNRFLSEGLGMDAVHDALAEEKDRLLRRLAELTVEEQRGRGTFDRTPHMTELEGESLELGRLLSRLSLSRSAAEAAAASETSAACPTCGSRRPIETQKRTVESTAGPVELIESVAHCPTCRRDFFPQREALGLDSRQCTPQLTRVAIHTAAATRSYQQAADLIGRTLGSRLSPKSIERLTNQVGAELTQFLETDRDAQQVVSREVVAPEMAVVSCDGGRVHTREPGRGPGVHNACWRETKNALFERMSASHTEAADDPCPRLPDTFRQVAHAAKIAEIAAFSADSPPPRQVRYEGPKRILRTCASSLVPSSEFGKQMQREAARRRFYEAKVQVFLGDGLPWNWSIHREHFPTFTPILDFIHAVQYLYAAARAWESTDQRRWDRYLELAELVWQGGVGDVIDRLRAELVARGVDPDETVADDSPHERLVAAARYFNNNRRRMDYPRYRRQGMPITSAPMESLIKQINQRVKGTEMTWNAPRADAAIASRPPGAEAILQVRSASLCEDDRLDAYLRLRPGHPLTRRPPPTVAA